MHIKILYYIQTNQNVIQLYYNSERWIIIDELESWILSKEIAHCIFMNKDTL